MVWFCVVAGRRSNVLEVRYVKITSTTQLYIA
jgi:hypothetical protein